MLLPQGPLNQWKDGSDPWISQPSPPDRPIPDLSRKNLRLLKKLGEGKFGLVRPGFLFYNILNSTDSILFILKLPCHSLPTHQIRKIADEKIKIIIYSRFQIVYYLFSIPPLKIQQVGSYMEILPNTVLVLRNRNQEVQVLYLFSGFTTGDIQSLLLALTLNPLILFSFIYFLVLILFFFVHCILLCSLFSSLFIVSFFNNCFILPSLFSSLFIVFFFIYCFLLYSLFSSLFIIFFFIYCFIFYSLFSSLFIIFYFIHCFLLYSLFSFLSIVCLLI